MQLESPNLTKKCYTMSRGNSFIFGVKRSEVKATRHKNIAGVCHGVDVSASFLYIVSIQ